MSKKTKLGLAVVGSIVLILLGTTGALTMAELVFDKSYMMTQEALADPGAALQLRIQFILCLAVVATGVVGLFKAIGMLRKK